MQTSPAFEERYPTVCPFVIRRTPLRMRWQQLTMLHWRYAAEEVQRLLPAGLEVETFDGSAWVGLVPFQMRVDIPFAPAMKRILHFPETNVRTYVRGRSGKPGVYFWSLEASSLPAAIVARATYRVPYFWARMTLHQSGDRIRFSSVRKWPGPKGARSIVDVEIGEPYRENDLTDLDRFLTNRWALYGSFGRFTTYAKMFHEPWPLHHANVVQWDDQLVAATGLGQPSGPPLVHYSPEVNVRCGFPERG